MRSLLTFLPRQRDAGPLTPPTAIAEGITASPSAVWAWVVLPTRSTDDLNTDELIARTQDGANSLGQLLPPGAPFHLKVQWGTHTADDYWQQETAALGPHAASGAAEYIALGARRIHDNQFPRRLVLLGVQMEMVDTRDLPSALRTSARRAGGDQAARDDAASALRRATDAARRWHDRMARSPFAARPATVAELFWSLRRDLRRTVGAVPVGDVAGPGQVARMLNDCYAVPTAEHMEVETDKGTRLVRCITSAQLGFPADDLTLPGGEWLKDLVFGEDAFGGPVTPVEVSIRGTVVSQNDARKRLSDAVALAKEQQREASKGVAQTPPDDVLDSQHAAEARRKDVRSGLAMVADNVVWVVDASTVTDLRSRCDALIDAYGGRGITLWEPTHVQDALWKSVVIGDKLRFGDCEQFRPLQTLVGSWFHGGSAVGDERGPVLGHVVGSTPQPYRLRLSDAALAGDPVTTTFTGGTGGGKSTGLMLATGAEAIYGAWVGLTDLKGDLGGVVPFVQRFGVATTIVDTTKAASGSMDTFRYVADPEEAASRVADRLLQMLQPERAQGSTEAEVRQAALAVAGYGAGRRSTHAVIELLRASTDGHTHAVGTELAGLAADNLARPFAGPPAADLGLPTGPGLVYMSYGDVTDRLPGRELARPDWLPGHRLAMALVESGLAYTTYMASRVHDIPKVVALTELHRLTGYAFGRDYVGWLARTGRALDVSLCLDTQAIGELIAVEGLLDQVSASHCFRVRTDDEADAQAKLLGLRPERVIRERQRSWGKGYCEVRDRRGRVAPVYFDYLDLGIAELLNTAPRRGRADRTPVPA